MRTLVQKYSPGGRNDANIPIRLTTAHKASRTATQTGSAPATTVSPVGKQKKINFDNSDFLKVRLKIIDGIETSDSHLALLSHYNLNIASTPLLLHVLFEKYQQQKSFIRRLRCRWQNSGANLKIVKNKKKYISGNPRRRLLRLPRCDWR